MGREQSPVVHPTGLLSWEKILCPPQHTALNVIDTPGICIIEAMMSDNHALIFTLI